ncbi:MAG: MFS transporter [Rhodospirillales bacterium]|jgi:predicted MFS family arabinose efflux permease
MKCSNGWPILVVVAAAALAVLIANGIRVSIPLYQVPMLSDVGWGRTEFGFAIAVQALMVGLFAPVFGGLADKFGPSRVIVAGALLYAAGLALMSVSTAPVTFTLTAGLMVGMAQAGCGQAIAMGAVAQLVPEERRSWALGIAVMGGSAGMLIILPVAQMFLETFGWSSGYLMLGLLTLVILLAAIPLSGRRKDSLTVAAVANLTVRQALQQAFHHRSYVLLIIGFFVCGFHVSFIGTHLPAYVSDLGLPEGTGAHALMLVGIVNLLGAYLAGVLGGKMNKPRLLTFIYIGRFLAISGLMLAPTSELTIYAFCAFMGLFWLSTVPLTGAVVASMFGTQYMSMLFGFVFLGHQVGAFSGVYLGGLLFDLTGSYDVVWWMGAALGIFAAIIHWPISEAKAPDLVPAT